MVPSRLGKTEAPDPELLEAPGVARHPTQTFTPKGIPVKYKPGGGGANSSRSNSRRRPFTPSSNRQLPSQVSSLAAAGGDVFDDSADDHLLASMPMPAEGEGRGDGGAGAVEDVFDDDDDFLLSQMEMPSPGMSAATASKRRRK